MHAGIPCHVIKTVCFRFPLLRISYRQTSADELILSCSIYANAVDSTKQWGPSRAHNCITVWSVAAAAAATATETGGRVLPCPAVKQGFTCRYRQKPKGDTTFITLLSIKITNSATDWIRDVHTSIWMTAKRRAQVVGPRGSHAVIVKCSILHNKTLHVLLAFGNLPLEGTAVLPENWKLEIG